MKRITYLLGAGASVNSMPILNALGDKMVQMADIYSRGNNIIIPEGWGFSELDQPEMSKVLQLLNYFGNKARLYGTIDTYAKSLYFKGEQRELHMLKVALSLFFSIWVEVGPDSTIRLRIEKDNDSVITKKYDQIDTRLVALLAALVVRQSDSGVVLRGNVSFITWNYDLQLEQAFAFLTQNKNDWETIRKAINFSEHSNENSTPRILHLNGFHGETSRANLMQNRLTFPDFNDWLNQLGRIAQSAMFGTTSFDEHLNFAWEVDNERSRNTLNQAIEVMKNTDVLVIVGYSFPAFNREIDTQLIKPLKRQVEVYYQDPKPNTFVVRSLAPPKIELSEITQESDLKQIFIPPVF